MYTDKNSRLCIVNVKFFWNSLPKIGDTIKNVRVQSQRTKASCISVLLNLALLDSPYPTETFKMPPVPVSHSVSKQTLQNYTKVTGDLESLCFTTLCCCLSCLECV